MSVASRTVPVVLFALVGAVVAILLVPPSTNVPPPEPVAATLNNEPLPLDGDEAQTLLAAREIARAYVLAPLTVSVSGGLASRTRTREELGARVDGERLVAIVRQARNAKSALRRNHERFARGKPLALPLPVTAEGARATLALLQMKDELDRAPVDARLDLEKNAISADEPGRRLDVYSTMTRLDEALTSGAPLVEAVVETLRAERTAEELRGIVIDDVLGYFETKYARDNRHDARTYNLRLAASKLNGYVLLPGETFDFNAVVGPRTEAMGYRVAPVIAQGELVDGVGGGTCQISGTLFGAAFFAGLEIVERRPHTRPSFYIKMGLDAAVAYPTITLKLKNPYPFPVVLHETVQGGVARAEILGPKRSRDVTFVRTIDEVTPFAEKEVIDPKLPRGARQLKQRGIPGFKITRYRIVQDGSFGRRERVHDSYPPTIQIWQVALASAEPDAAWKPEDDAHPEYVADELLTIAQGPGVTSPAPARGAPPVAPKGGAMVETRTPGRYGYYGWMAREGFAKQPAGAPCANGDEKCEARSGVD